MSRRGLGVALVALGLAGCSRHPPTAREFPLLAITVVAADAPRAPRALAPGAAALALAGLRPEETSRLRDSLAASTDDAIKRSVPLFFDLEEGTRSAPTDPLRQLLPDVPALTAAANVLGAPWTTTGLSIELATSCPATASRCAPLFSIAPSDPLVRRARTLAWGLANAAIVRPSSGAKDALVTALRAKAGAGTIALVFDGAEGTLPAPPLDALTAQAKRALAHLAQQAPLRPALENLSAATPHWALPLTLATDEILVVPRLSALARLPQFEAELTATGDFAWVVRPTVGTVAAL